MKKILFCLIAALAFAKSNINIYTGFNSIQGTFKYKGTQNNIKDIGINNIYNIGIKVNMDNKSFIPGFFADISYFSSFFKNNTLNKNIIIDNIAYHIHKNITSKLTYANIKLVAYYSFLKTKISYMKLGAGFYGIIGHLKVAENQKYSDINFKFYYPSLYVKTLIHPNNFQFGFETIGTRIFRKDNAYSLNIFGGYKINTLLFNIGYKHTKMKINNYDSWYSNITTSGVYFEISKSF